MPIFNLFSLRGSHSVTLLALTLSFGCSGARLDPTTRAVTFDTPALEGSSAPANSAAPAPTNGSTAAPAQGAVTAPSKPNESGNAEAKADSTPPGNQVCSRLPDPKATVTDNWIRVGVRYERGALSIASVKAERSRHAEPASRRMGRFAAELWIGCELIERVRFDFPLLATEGPPKAKEHVPNFDQEGVFFATLLLPNSDRATRLELRDRARETDAGHVLTVPMPLKMDGNKAK